MTWTVEYSDELGIVILAYTGRVTGREIQEAAAARIDMGKRESVTEFLIDTKRVEADESATFDIYDIPNKMYNEKHVPHESNLAIVEPDSEKSKELARFFETACLNRGWAAKIFKDRDSAIAWLQQIARRRSTDGDR